MTPPEIALDQFRRRRAFAAKSGLSHAEQDAKLRPWAHVALVAGADLAHLPPDLREAVESYRRSDIADYPACKLVALDLCPSAEALAKLAEARDAAIDATPVRPEVDADPALHARYRQAEQLAHLAAYLGAPGYRCASAAQPERKAA